MPEYLAPGVYIEERPGQRSIEGVSTSTTAFVGMTARGPVQGPPVLVTSFGDFQRTFGGFLDITPDPADLGEHGHLPLAIKQYFDNGGRRAFVARAYKPQGTGIADSKNYRMTQLAAGVVARLRATAPKGNTYAIITSSRGFVAGTSKLVRDGGALAPSVVINDLDAGTLKAHVAALPENYRSDTAFVQLTPAVTAAGAAKLIAREPGLWGEEVQVQVLPSPGAAVNTTAPIAAAATSIPVASATGLYRGCVIQINDVTVGAGGEAHITNVHYATVTAIAGNVLTIAAPATALPAYATPDKTWVSLAEVDIIVSWSTIVERFRGTWRYVDVASPPTGWSASDAAVFNALHSVWLALHQGSTLVRLNSTDTAPLASIFPAAYAENDPLATHPTTLEGGPVALGPDGALPANTPDVLPGYPEYVGNPGAGPGARSALASLADEESIALVAIPGITGVTVQEALITHAELAKYRFAVIDAPHKADIAHVRSHRAHYDSQYTAIYYPWIQIAHPLTGNLIEVPPSGSVLGLYASTDVNRGVFKAPANVVVANATDLVTRATMGEQEVLNPEGINVIRDFRPHNRGIRVWGARTISSDPEWIYVNVRRLFIFLEHSIDNGTQWVVFEPNNQDLWARVRRTIETFLEAQWRLGALFGAKKEDAYYVKCDRSTMSLDDIANGRLVVEIGVAPTRPAEFVIFRIGQFTADASSN